MDHVATMDDGFYIDDYAIGVMVPNLNFVLMTVFIRIVRWQDSTMTEMAWDVDWGNGGTHIYQYNYSHDPNSIYMLCNAQEASQGCQVIFPYNISQNNRTKVPSLNRQRELNDLFYNNTI